MSGCPYEYQRAEQPGIDPATVLGTAGHRLGTDKVLAQFAAVVIAIGKHQSHDLAGGERHGFVIDRRVSLIGSYNMDPRSRIWNSEIALLIHSEEFGEIVHAEMDEEFQPGNAYRVELDERGKLFWTIENDEGQEYWPHDPGTTTWQRFLTRLIGWVPVENEL